MDSNELKRRTFEFAIRIARLVESLPRTVIGRLVQDQLGRAGTSVGANYRASCKARSRAEFISKMGTVEEEADETAFGLEFIIAYGLLRGVLVLPLLTEAQELGKIFGKSRITATVNGRQARTVRPIATNRQ